MSRERSRQRKLQRKSQKRREQLRRFTSQSALPPGAARDFEESEHLIEDGKPEQAIPILEELARRYPRRVEILIALADAQRRTGAHWSYQATCEKVVAANPDAPEVWLALGSVALANTQVATAHRAFAHVAATWPDHPDVEYAQRMQSSLGELLAKEFQRLSLNDVTGFRVMIMHDAINLHLQCGHFDKVCTTVAHLLAICQTFAPALNNRSTAHFFSARYDDAIADCRRVLELDPTNYHALSNLTRYLYLFGRFDDAQKTAEALKICRSREADAFLKKAETFAILGDWETVQQTVNDGKDAWNTVGEVPALAEHLAGVAMANLGDLKTAREYWKRASTRIEWAKANLEDSKRPISERHGPWAFPLENWVPRGMMEKLHDAVSGARRENDTKRIVQRHFEQYPQMELLADPMLQRGDPKACEFLIRTAPLANRPAIFEALMKFALSQRGSDDLRSQALMTLSKEGYIEGQVEIWREGSLRPIGLMSQEIYSEPPTRLPPGLNDLMVLAFEALRDGRGADAQRVLDDFLELRPDDVTAKFNRAIARSLQGHDDEALDTVRQIHRDHPDYFFARVHLATECISDGDLEQAKTLLAPISQMKRLHVSEFAAWTSANIQLALSNDDRKTARSLLNAWEQVDPNDPRIKVLRSRIDGKSGMLSRLSRSLFKAPRHSMK